MNIRVSLLAVAVGVSVTAGSASALPVTESPRPWLEAVALPPEPVVAPPVTMDPGPNPTVPADENPVYVPPVDPPQQVVDEQIADGQSTWRCVDPLGYEFIFGGLAAPDASCAELAHASAAASYSNSIPMMSPDAISIDGSAPT